MASVDEKTPEPKPTKGKGPRALIARLRSSEDLREFAAQPTISLDLMLGATEGNDPFFARITREHYAAVRAPHPKLPVIRRGGWGVALCRLPGTFDAYFKLIDGSARRNFKKAERAGCTFRRIEFNEHRADVGDIRTSAKTRQGEMPADILTGEVGFNTDPPSTTNVHDYPWFGVFKGDRLVAYASCFIAGELANINHIYGHAEFQDDGIVPRLIIGMVDYVYATYPYVKYFGYETYFGAAESLRRFKRKMGMIPYHVNWVLDGANPTMRRAAAEPAPPKLELPTGPDHQLVYRLRVSGTRPLDVVQGAEFHYLDGPAVLPWIRKAALARHGRGLVRTIAKLATPSRQYYCVTMGDEIVSDGWVMLGKCKHYPIEPDAALIGPTWTDPDKRGKGLATFALRSAINALFLRGYDVSYIDTSTDNVAMQRVIARCGYGPPVATFPRTD